jgi:Xaa-Pro aminopeptidase
MREGPSSVERFSLEVSESLASFFYERVGEAQERAGAALTPEVEAYVVHLLARFVRETGVAGRHSPPLALQYLSARSQSGSARAQALRGVGDRALFISGAVPRSLDRTPVNVGYVRSIGESAYRGVAEGRRALAVFEALAAAFEAASEVIGDVVEPAQGGDLLGLYERWRRDHSRRDARALTAAGVILGARGSELVH